MKLLRFVAMAVVLLLLAGALAVWMGACLPREHTASASIVLESPQARVWRAIEDVTSQPEWRTGLRTVIPLPPQNRHPCWQENNSMGRMTMCEVSASAPSTRTVRIADASLPFGGEWVYELTPQGPNRTVLTITEHGTTGPAIWRFLGHYVFHEDTSIKQYERDLARHISRST